MCLRTRHSSRSYQVVNIPRFYINYSTEFSLIKETDTTQLTTSFLV